MIQAKQSINSPASGLQLGAQQSGCCVETLEACLYRFQFATTPTTFTGITINGTLYTFNHTYSTPEALNNAIIETLTKPVNAGGAGLVIPSSDLKVYLDSFATTADRLTIEMISGIVIDNFITNVGTQSSATAVCTKQTMCVNKITYVLGSAIDLVIGNTQLTLATYATAALLRTAVLAQISAQGLTGEATAEVRTATDVLNADLWIYTKPNVPVYHNDALVARGQCYAKYV